MYFVRLQNSQKILLSYYMLTIMFRLNLDVDSVENNVLHL